MELETQGSQNANASLDYANLSYNEMAEVAGSEINEGQAQAQPKNIEGLSPDEMLKMLNETKDQTEGDLEIPEDDDKENIEVQPEEDTENEDFEIIYKGQVEKISKDEVIKLAQMGKDYTQKTQELAETRKSFEAEKKQTAEQLQNYVSKLETKEAEFNQKFDTYERFDMALDVIKENDPDYYQEFQNRVAGIIRQYENPVTKKLFSKYENEINSLKAEHENLKLSGIREQYSKQETELKNSIGKQLETIGIFPDWKAVQQEWVNGAKDVKTALYALYGDQIQKAYTSKFKVDAAKKAASVKVPTMSKKPAPKLNKTVEGGYNEILNGLLSGKLKI